MSFVLPPGCGFYPSEDLLLGYYLASKNRANKDADDVKNLNGYDLIKELDLYKYKPFDLPENACYAYGHGGKRRHWYCYAPIRVREENRGGRKRAKGGYWRRIGRARNVVDRGGKVVVGSRTTFVYYLGNSPKSAIKTDWILYEYALVNNDKASFVLCRVFVKSRGGNSISENVLSCCAEESISAMHHVGVQCDGFVTPDIVEAKVDLDNSVDRRNNLSKYPVRLSSNEVTVRPTSAFEFPFGFQANELVRTSRLTNHNMSVDCKPAQHLSSILEEDFIELDDLVD